MNVKIILKDKVKEPLPFPDNKKNRTCRENVRVKRGWKEESM
jgi:hypothetical protein